MAKIVLDCLGWIALLNLELISPSFVPPAASESSPEVEMTLQQDSWSVTTANYSATVEPDGCLTQLNVGGRELLAANVAISRGSYFFRDQPLKLSPAQQTADDTLSAANDLASIQYAFEDQAMAWTLTNHSDQPLIFFVVLSTACQAGSPTATAPPQKGFFNTVSEQSSWFLGLTKVELSGTNRLWGPWEGKHQVVELNLAPAESRTLHWQFASLNENESAVLAELLRDPDDAPLVIRAPRDYQVIQRSSIDSGTLMISGRVNVECEWVRARISGQDRRGRALPVDHQKLVYDPTSRAFAYATPMPSGGWYALTVEALIGDEVVAEQTVEHFGIGEVFVGAGQSNSTNSGQFRIEPVSGMVSSFGGSAWQLATDPQPGVADRSQGGSYYPAFGDLMYEKFGVPIGIAATGFGGTSVNQWQPDGDLHKWMMTRIHQLGPGGFRAVLWHQGESDVGMDSDEYYTKLKQTITASKQQAGWEFPWFVAQVSYHNPSNPRFETTRTAQAKLWEDRIALPGPDTDTLGGDNRDFDGQGIHFSPQGLKAHGRMWFDQVAPWLESRLN